jgi:UPF0716 protein FxsA
VPILVLLFIVVPIAELYVIIKIGSLIGILPTLVILIADALLGSMLLRHQGRAAWRRFSGAIAEGRFPGREAADGVMIAVGGTLLLAPGFITDVVGLLLLLPPTRALIRHGLFRYLRRRLVVVDTGAGAYGGVRDRPPSRSRSYDFEGTGREVPSNGTGEQGNTADDSRLPRLPPT